MSDPAIRLSGVGKMYKLFASRNGQFAEALGISRFLPRSAQHREFWALRGIDLELGACRRVGVIGRNGAGKSTMLKLITGNLAPTEGTVEVNGSVQALLEAGAGFHPDFTGEENIRAALTYQGYKAREIAAAERDIAEFTELGEFLAQPFTTYSSGMQARLAFAVATTMRPEILIVDEMLSAGDAYFLAKSSERMRELVRDSGASVLLVSHSLDHITMFCEEAIWLDRGRTVLAGRALDVVKAYEQHTRLLEDRRLRARNTRRSRGEAEGELDNYSETLQLRLTLNGGGAECDVSEIRLLRGDETEETVLVGDAQDGDPSHASHLVLQDSEWTAPRGTERGLCRSLVAGERGSASGSAAFHLFALDESQEYAVEFQYRCRGGELTADVFNGSERWATSTFNGVVDGWRTGRVELPVPATHAKQKPSRWPGEASLRIETVRLLGPARREQAVFEAGAPMTVVLAARAHKTGVYPVTAVAVLYRADGIRVTSNVGEEQQLELRAGETFTFELHYPSLNLGNGHYVFSAAIYRHLTSLGESQPYDLIDRSYEFEVVGQDHLSGGIFRHPGEWIVR